MEKQGMKSDYEETDVKFKYLIDSPLGVVFNKDIEPRLLSRLIDLYLITGIRNWFISDEINFPIPGNWITRIDEDEKIIDFYIPHIPSL